MAASYSILNKLFCTQKTYVFYARSLIIAAKKACVKGFFYFFSCKSLSLKAVFPLYKIKTEKKPPRELHTENSHEFPLPFTGQPLYFSVFSLLPIICSDNPLLCNLLTDSSF